MSACYPYPNADASRLAAEVAAEDLAKYAGEGRSEPTGKRAAAEKLRETADRWDLRARHAGEGRLLLTQVEM